MNEDSDLNDDMDDDELDDPIGRPKCPFCKSIDICEHFVFEYDLSFFERKSGRWEEINELEQVIKNGFLNLIVNNKKVGFFEQYHQYCEPDNKYFEELWDDASANYDPKKQSIDFSYDNFIRLLIYIFDFSISDGDAFIKHYGSGGAPGFDSAMVACFVDDVAESIDDAKEIIKEYLSDIEFDSEDPKEYNKLGLENSANGHNYKAITEFSKALYLDPEYAEAYFNRGNAKCAVRDDFAAKYDYLKAIKFDPRNEKYQMKIKVIETTYKK